MMRALVIRVVTILVGAIPASLCVLLAVPFILVGFLAVSSLNSLGPSVLFIVPGTLVSVCGAMGAWGLWVSAFEPAPIRTATAAKLIAGIVAGLATVGADELPVELLAVLLGPLLVAIFHLWRWRHSAHASVA
jgi:hypothetical protein